MLLHDLVQGGSLGTATAIRGSSAPQRLEDHVGIPWDSEIMGCFYELTDREGRVVDYYSRFTSPESGKLVSAIEKLL